MPSTLTAEDVLSANCEYDHVAEVRAVGPALVIVIEHEAPMRLMMLSGSESEENVLASWCRENDPIRELLETFWAAKEAREGDLVEWPREDAHSQRLEDRTRLSTLRVAC